ncbi:hypothetical protein Daesc_006164 [Daldinia eschscholtzii]|uniref:Uncharacterized protein n=1 Tax=Daldinia eschscholtzii TaxID=292717 RepID=A0AAX6MHJ4_9PEZI
METEILPGLLDIRNYIRFSITTERILSNNEKSKLAAYLKKIDEHYCTLRLLKGSLGDDYERYDTCAKGMNEADDLKELIQGILDKSLA